MNHEDQFEQRLRRQPSREIPTRWRAEILSVAQAAGPRPSTLNPRPSLLSTLNHQLSTLFWPHPKAWAGLAAVWVLILTLQLASRDRTEVAARQTPPPSPEMLMVLRQQKLLLAELVERPEPRAADRPEIGPVPTAQRPLSRNFYRLTVMNPKLKKFLTTSWNDPRAFFFLVALFWLVPFAMALGTAHSQNPPTGDVLLVEFISAFISGLAFVGFVFSWIPPIRRLFERLLRRRVFYLACLITLVALFYTVENWRGKRAWEKYRREWEAKGEKFDLVSLAPPPVPDDQNFAMTPLLKPMLDFSLASGRIVWRDTNALAHLQSISATLQAEQGGKEQLPLGNLGKGTLADLEACREFYRSNTNYPQPAKSGTAAEDILIALAKFDADITELREAAATCPNSRYPLTYDLEPPSNILLPHLGYLKGLSLVVSLRTIAELETGRMREAFKDWQLGFRLSDSIRGEPILINHMVRIGTLAIPLQGVREGLARHAWNDAQLVELEQYLGSINLLAEYKNAIRGERAFNTGGLDYMRRQRLAPDGNQFTGDSEGGVPIGPVFPGGWFYQNMLAISEMHQDSVLACVDEHAHRVFPESNQRLEAATATLVNGRFHPYRVFAAMLFPAVAKANLKAAHMQTFVDAARIACGLERYRQANRGFPETLAALVPRFMAAIPTDVMDGQPLRYRTTPDGGYVIYSIGWNAKDDGGELAFSRNGKNVNTDEGDWVWTCPAK